MLAIVRLDFLNVTLTYAYIKKNSRFFILYVIAVSGKVGYWLLNTMLYNLHEVILFKTENLFKIESTVK